LLLILGIAAGALLVVGGGVAIVFVVRGKDPEAKAKDKGEPAPAPIASRTTGPAKKEVDPNSPTPEVVERVKKATLRVLARFKDGKGASGSGFVEKQSGLVLTNAHVVGELEDGPGCDAINLVVNSGEGDKEYRLGGELLAVDRVHDLALVRPFILDVGERHIVPGGLTIPRSPKLTELQRVFVFGFPLGAEVGKEITVSETSISSLRKDSTGKLVKIQVKGGMTQGNSGGPVVDAMGNVIGVAVSGILGTELNFAIPSEVVHAFIAQKR
jgi:S1-C subfamily serine protease